MAAATVTSMPAYQPYAGTDARAYTGFEAPEYHGQAPTNPLAGGYQPTSGATQQRYLPQQTPVHSLAGLGNGAPAPSVLYNAAGNVASPSAYLHGGMPMNAAPVSAYPTKTITGGTTIAPRSITPTATAMPAGVTYGQYQPSQYQTVTHLQNPTTHIVHPNASQPVTRMPAGASRVTGDFGTYIPHGAEFVQPGQALSGGMVPTYDAFTVPTFEAPLIIHAGPDNDHQHRHVEARARGASSTTSYTERHAVPKHRPMQRKKVETRGWCC